MQVAASLDSKGSNLKSVTMTVSVILKILKLWLFQLF